ncbi:hypothetical protein SprV_0200820000 [Sparganum proliferum]
MDDEHLPKQIFFEDVATGSHRKGGQTRRYKDTLENCLERLQTDAKAWKDLTLDRPAWRRAMKTGAAIREANEIVAAKFKGRARKSEMSLIRNANFQPPLNLPAPSAHLPHSNRPRCLTASAVASPTTPAPTPTASTTTTTLTTDALHTCAPSPSIAAISTVPAAASATTVTTKTLIPASNQDALDGASTTTLAITNPTSSDRDPVSVCPHCDLTLTLRTGPKVECVGQKKAVFCASSREEEAVVVAVTDSVGTKHPPPGNIVCPNEGVEVTRDNQLARLQHRTPGGRVGLRRTWSSRSSELVIGGV